MATLVDIVNELKDQKKGQEKLITGQNALVETISRMTAQSSSDRLQALEDKSEKSIAPPQTSAAYRAGEATGEIPPFVLGFLTNPLKALGPLIAGVTAITAGFAGLRGWEIPVLKNIKSIGTGLTNLIPTKLVDDIRQAFVNVRGNILRTFGLDATLKAFGSADDATLKTPLTTQLANYFTDLRKQFMLKYFGIGVDGKATFKITDTGKSLLKIQEGFSRIIKPFQVLATGVSDFISGAGKPIVDFLSSIGSGAAGFAKLVGKILWPVGIIMSIFDGVSAYRDEEGSQYDKITAGISAAVGDFIGAPLDLLKSLLSWTLGKFGFDETAEAIQNFSIEEKLTNLLNGIFDFPQKAFEWIKGAISDPTAALQSLWTGLVGEDGLFGVVKNWLTGFYEFFTNLLPDVGAMAAQLKQQLVDLLPDWAKNLIGVDDVTPEQRRQAELAQAQEQLTNLQAQESTLLNSADPNAGYSLQGNRAAQDALRNQISNLANELDVTTGTPLSIPSDASSLLPPSNQTGSTLRMDEVVEGVRNQQQPAIVPVPVPTPAPQPRSSSGNGNGGGAFLLPAAPTVDIMDGVVNY